MRLHHITTLALGLAALAARPMPATAHDNDTLRFSVDVAEDFTQFVSTLVTPSDPYPKRGATFVTQPSVPT